MLLALHSAPLLRFKCTAPSPSPSTKRVASVRACASASGFSSDDKPRPGPAVPDKGLFQMNATELRQKVAALGLSAVLAYGLFDGVTYTTFFVLAFLGYEKSTGQNPAANLKALLGVVLLMWTGNNITRPFRVAGAAALAPLLDRLLKKIQKTLNLPTKAFAFMLVVASFAGLCFSVVALLILSRWGK